MNPTWEEIEKIEALVRDLHRPKSGDEVSRWWIWEKHYDDKVIYYLKLGMTVEELQKKCIRRRTEERAMWERRHEIETKPC